MVATVVVPAVVDLVAVVVVTVVAAQPHWPLETPLPEFDTIMHLPGG